MKKLVILLILGLFVYGCASVPTVTTKEFDISYLNSCTPGSYSSMTRTGVDATITIEDKGDKCRVIMDYSSPIKSGAILLMTTSGEVNELICLYSKDKQFTSYDADPSTHLVDTCSVTK